MTSVAGGSLSPAEAVKLLRRGKVRHLDEFAVLDLGRAERKGVPEIVYAPGKTPVQVAKIYSTLLNSGTRVIVSGSSPGHEAEIRRALPGTPLRSAGQALVVGSGEPVSSGGRVGAISADISDLPVMKEAVAVAPEMGVIVERYHNVGWQASTASLSS